MALWLILIFLHLTLALLLLILSSSRALRKSKLPPSPSAIPILGNLLWLTNSFSGLEPLLRQLRAELGPMVTLYICSRPAIFIMDRDLTHRSLVENGEAFAHRTPPMGTGRALGSNLHSINITTYGPLWRLLRRNLASEIFGASRIKSYSHIHKWALDILVEQVKAQAKESGGVVSSTESLQHAIFCLYTSICFGVKLDDKVIRNMRIVQLDLLSLAVKLSVFNLLPKAVMVLFWRRWKKLLEIRKKQDDLFLPIIRACVCRKQKQQEASEGIPTSYVDSLLNLKHPEERERELEEDEIINLCSEFLNAGTETTWAALQWIMANLVKHKRIRTKLSEEIKTILGNKRLIEEDDLIKLPYLRAVVLEGLRRHPPAHFLLPHTVNKDVVLNGYMIPTGATVNYAVAEIGRDGSMWTEPMEFKPERFMAHGEGEGVDVTGSREIKMMPFGAGRRICPGLSLAMLHLQYFTANLINEFQWEAVEEVDLSEEPGLTVVMKKPFRARIIARDHTA